MIFDPKTREAYPTLNDFFKGTDHASGSFNGLVPTMHVKGVHINPNPAVQLVQDKNKLLNKLEKDGFPVPQARVSLNDLMPVNGEFSILDLEDHFGQEYDWGEKPFQLRHNNGSTGFHEFGDVMEWLRRFNEQDGTSKHNMRKQGVFVQPGIVAPKTTQVTTIPNAHGKKLRRRGEYITNGILNDEPIGEEIAKLSRNVVDDLDLDYATVTVLFDPKTGEMEVLDVNTRMQPVHAEPLHSYVQMLQNAARKK